METKRLTMKPSASPPCKRVRVFAHRSQIVQPGVTAAPGFDYTTQLAGQTGHFTVYYARSLQKQGLDVAQAVLQRCEADYARLTGAFGLEPGHFNIIVAPLSTQHDGTGGAYHHTCLASDLYCDVQFRPEVNAALTSALVVAEEVEVFEAVQ